MRDGKMVAGPCFKSESQLRAVRLHRRISTADTAQPRTRTPAQPRRRRNPGLPPTHSSSSARRPSPQSTHCARLPSPNTARSHPSTLSTAAQIPPAQPSSSKRRPTAQARTTHAARPPMTPQPPKSSTSQGPPDQLGTGQLLHLPQPPALPRPQPPSLATAEASSRTCLPAAPVAPVAARTRSSLSASTPGAFNPGQDHSDLQAAILASQASHSQELHARVEDDLRLSAGIRLSAKQARLDHEQRQRLLKAPRIFLLNHGYFLATFLSPADGNCQYATLRALESAMQHTNPVALAAWLASATPASTASSTALRREIVQYAEVRVSCLPT